MKTIKKVLRPFYRQFLAYKNQGNDVTCNICGRSFKRLRPIVGRHGDGSTFVEKDSVGRCWLCDSYPRMRLMWRWLEEEYKIQEKKGIKILHVAPERSISSEIRRIQGIEYNCVDKHCEGYSYPDYVEDGDVCRLDFSDNEFDLVICNHVLEHVKDDQTAISEIFRVLKNNGTAILMVPVDYELTRTDEPKPDEILTPEECERRFGQFDHVRQYGTDYFTRLEASGFTVRRIKYDSDIALRYGFIPDEEIIVCIKPEKHGRVNVENC